MSSVLKFLFLNIAYIIEHCFWLLNIFFLKIRCYIIEPFFFFLSVFVAAETVLLAFQNYILMLGSSAFIPALLVPAMGGTDVSLQICFLFMSWGFSGLVSNLLCPEGRQSASYADTTLCSWYQDTSSSSFRYEVACCCWRLFCLCSPHCLHH